jgi:hypothetical protein
MKDIYVYPRKTDQGESPGMELRDWFAGQAIVGLLSNPKYDNHDNGTISIFAYNVADYLLDERGEI